MGIFVSMLEEIRRAMERPPKFSFLSWLENLLQYLCHVAIIAFLSQIPENPESRHGESVYSNRILIGEEQSDRDVYLPASGFYLVDFFQ